MAISRNLALAAGGLGLTIGGLLAGLAPAGAVPMPSLRDTHSVHTAVGVGAAVGPNSTSTFSVSCPPGERALGGGYQASSNLTDQAFVIAMSAALPLQGSPTTGWQVTLRGTPTAPSIILVSGDLSINIVCAPLS